MYNIGRELRRDYSVVRLLLQNNIPYLDVVSEQRIDLYSGDRFNHHYALVANDAIIAPVQFHHATSGLHVRDTLSFEVVGACHFNPEGEFFVPFSQWYPPTYRGDILYPPDVPEQQARLLELGEINIRVGYQGGSYGLFLDDEDQYLYAKMLL